MYAQEGQTMTLSLVGDVILTRRIRTCRAERFRALVDLISEADASIGNLEVLLHDFEGYPAAESGGTYMRAPPWVADELRWAGFDILAAANNHTMDYSHGGMEATMRELSAREIPFAGLGRNLAEARAPAYVDTPAGRVALVATCSTIKPGAEAGPQRADMSGRPGLSPLHVETSYTLPSDAHAELRRWSERLGFEAIKAHAEERGLRVPGEDHDGFTWLNLDGSDLEFVEGEEFTFEREPDDEDLAAITAEVRAADRQADWVVASLHSHEGGAGLRIDHSVPPFHEEFAHACIDAGADVVFGHGPHVIRGIEVYDGAPVFYSLGDCFLQNETVTKLPQEMYDRYDLGPDAVPADVFDERVFEGDQRVGHLYDATEWESVLPICRFENDALDRIDLYPLDLGYDEPRPRRGRPLLATGDTAERILERLIDLSRPYATDIAIEDGRGVIDVGTQ